MLIPFPYNSCPRGTAPPLAKRDRVKGAITHSRKVFKKISLTIILPVPWCPSGCDVPPKKTTTVKAWKSLALVMRFAEPNMGRAQLR